MAAPIECENEPMAERGKKDSKARSTKGRPTKGRPTKAGGRAAKPHEAFRDALVRTVIAGPLLEWFEDPKEHPPPYDVIIDLNLDFRVTPDGGADESGGRRADAADEDPELPRVAARKKVFRLVREVTGELPAPRGKRFERVKLHENKSRQTPQYVFATLTERQIRELVRRDRPEDDPDGSRDPERAASLRAIHRIWPDFPLDAHISRSVATIKCDAARISFSALGEGVVWAVLDSGIDENHIHFHEHANLDLPLHRDFTDADPGSPLTDDFGHGTHVAGIIAGEVPPRGRRRSDRERAADAADAAEGAESAESEAAADTGTDDDAPPEIPPMLGIAVRRRDESGAISSKIEEIDCIAGMAPKAKLVSLKVLDEAGRGNVSNLITALSYIQEVNGHGRRLKIHGVNMSVGYNFDPEWFACGHSPLCVEVDRLVRSGVVVVVAAGNTGYGKISTQAIGTTTAGIDLTINDPGNAEKAITVGATHRDSPHTYGVSYFSSKGPTGDGRVKPDLVAPGEKIVSCAAGKKRRQIEGETGGGCLYREESGTSMAAPHVSGAIAAFLSVRQEFWGRPEEVKQVFLDSATDLGRERYFQGRGLVDLIRAIQSV
jgi:subtilisin family serine protease